MNEQRKRAPGMNIGSASIIMVFSVLCLTIFAVLSFITANNEYKLSVKSADAVKAYYAADTNAVLKVADEIEAGKTTIKFQEAVDDNQAIEVELEIKDNKIETKSWKLVSTAEWGADNNNLWDGDLS